MLYAIVDRRHEKRSTAVTTNLSFKQWGTMFPGAACVVALVDCFAQHCHVVDIDAGSWRPKNASDLLHLAYLTAGNEPIGPSVMLPR